MSTRVHPSTANPTQHMQQQQQPNNNNYQQQRRYGLLGLPTWATCAFITLCFLWFMGICFAFGVLIYVISLCISPKDPTFRIDSLTLSNLNVSSSPNQISANWNITTTLTNRDKRLHFKFSAITFAIYYNHDIQVGLTGFQTMYISPGSPVMWFAKGFSGSSGHDDVSDTTISMIRKDIDDAGRVKFDVQFQTTVEKTYKKLRTNHPYPWIVVCKNMELAFGSSPSSQYQMLNRSYKCKISGYKRR